MLTSEELEAIRQRNALAIQVYAEHEIVPRESEVDRRVLLAEVDRLRPFEGKVVGAAMICDALWAENERLRAGIQLAKEWLRKETMAGTAAETMEYDRGGKARESFRAWLAANEVKDGG